MFQNADVQEAIATYDYKKTIPTVDQRVRRSTPVAVHNCGKYFWFLNGKLFSDLQKLKGNFNDITTLYFFCNKDNTVCLEVLQLLLQAKSRYVRSEKFKFKKRIEPFYVS